MKASSTESEDWNGRKKLKETQDGKLNRFRLFTRRVNGLASQFSDSWRLLALQYVRVLERREEFSDSAGVRPSSGAAA